jgi:hypothetical protein
MLDKQCFHRRDRVHHAQSIVNFVLDSLADPLHAFIVRAFDVFDLADEIPNHLGIQADSLERCFHVTPKHRLFSVGKMYARIPKRWVLEFGVFGRPKQTMLDILRGLAYIVYEYLMSWITPNPVIRELDPREPTEIDKLVMKKVPHFRVELTRSMQKRPRLLDQFHFAYVSKPSRSMEGSNSHPPLD